MRCLQGKQSQEQSGEKKRKQYDILKHRQAICKPHATRDFMFIYSFNILNRKQCVFFCVRV